MNIPPRPFKLSVIACAICYANLTYAQDAQVQALQTIQVKASNAEQSSEQTKAYNVKNSSIVKLLYYSYKIRKKLEITHRLSRST
ncbi:hypothetical protein KTI39_15335, partial [Acinetobacter baumannii]|nr:hypothetical protein [Acinetobacter baumannii]